MLDTIANAPTVDAITLEQHDRIVLGDVNGHVLSVDIAGPSSVTVSYTEMESPFTFRRWTVPSTHGVRVVRGGAA
jgi:hypothetical protein